MRFILAAGNRVPLRPLVRQALIALTLLYGMVGAAQEPAGEAVRLNLPAEIEMQGLVDYVSERLNIRVLYDEKLANKKITIRAPGDIPAASLVGVLQSALRIKGLALVDAGPPGWKKIVESTRLVDYADPLSPDRKLEDAFADSAVTQVFVLQHGSPDRIKTLIEPSLTTQGGNAIALEDQKILIVSDFASTVQRIARLIVQVDVPVAEAIIEFIPVEHSEAAHVAEQVSALLRADAGEPQAAGQAAQVNVTVTSDVRTNQLLVVGRPEEVRRVQEITRRLDVALPTRLAVYNLANLSAARLDRLIVGMLPPQDATRLYRATLDTEANLLIVSTTDSIHAQLAQLIERLDTPAAAASQSRLKMYRLKHITAAQALETLRGIEGSLSPPPPSGRGQRTDGRYRLLNETPLPGPNQPQLAPRRELPTPPAVIEEPSLDVRSSIDLRSEIGLTTPDAPFFAGGASVTADVPSNTLIVMADPALQQLYAEVIEQLDRPRPQVLIEAKIVVLDTTDNFSLGVEFSAGDRTGAKRLLAFNSFGLSAVDPVSGALAIVPGLGFNGTLVDPDVADVVLRAFTRHRKSKVISAPRVLVNDNENGILTSVTEIPFTSVNASQTVATTSFAGFADAGTTIEVTPHISDGTHLQLQYRITLNEFQGATTATGGVPPPRQTDEVESVVTIPDGHTLIVGGLHRTSYNHDTDSLPFIEKIPILRHAFSLQAENARETSLFVFLRPVILRDDKFRDLKYYSKVDLHRANLPGDVPHSEPILIE